MNSLELEVNKEAKRKATEFLESNSDFAGSYE